METSFKLEPHGRTSRAFNKIKAVMSFRHLTSLADIEGAISATPRKAAGFRPLPDGGDRRNSAQRAGYHSCSASGAIFGKYRALPRLLDCLRLSTTLFRDGRLSGRSGVNGRDSDPTAFTTIALRLPARQHATGFAIFGLTANLAPAIGPGRSAGWLTENLSWQYVFLCQPNTRNRIHSAGILFDAERASAFRSSEKRRLVRYRDNGNRLQRADDRS